MKLLGKCDDHSKHEILKEAIEKGRLLFVSFFPNFTAERAASVLAYVGLISEVQTHGKNQALYHMPGD